MSDKLCKICSVNISETTDPYVIVQFITERRLINGEVVKEVASISENVYCSQKCLFIQASEGVDEKGNLS